MFLSLFEALVMLLGPLLPLMVRVHLSCVVPYFSLLIIVWLVSLSIGSLFEFNFVDATFDPNSNKERGFDLTHFKTHARNKVQCT